MSGYRGRLSHCSPLPTIALLGQGHPITSPHTQIMPREETEKSDVARAATGSTVEIDALQERRGEYR